MSEPLRTFLDRYADAYAALDVQALAEMYAMPCLFIGSGQTASFETPRELLRHLGYVAERRREEGVGAAVATRVQAMAEGGGQTVVLVHWILERTGTSPLRFRSLYHLVHADGSWRIAVSSSLDD
ncbi:MAG: nuclear transport factor 2 family protein [Bacteroidota bacterium]